MARHPEWFDRLDTILEVVRRSDLEWFGRKEIKAIFGCGERDSIRLLHKLGAAEKDNALSLPRTALLSQLDAIHAGATYAAFLRQRRGVAEQLTAARAEAAARQFRVAVAPVEQARRFEELPPTITLFRPGPSKSGRLEIRYTDGADLMRQLAEFLRVAGSNREQFFGATEPGQ